jgi:hypothetical protein
MMMSEVDMTGAYELNLETGEFVEIVAPENPAPRVNHFGCLGEKHAPVFGGYPMDGECECGMWKHHVHCATCGGVSQVG